MDIGAGCEVRIQRPTIKPPKTIKDSKRPVFQHMVARGNPFTPSFGTTPPVLAGRDDLLDDWETALESGPHHPDYTLLLVGMRGAGKTVLLNAVEDIARQRSWPVIAEDASHPGIVSRLTDAAWEILGDIDRSGFTGRITGLNVAGVGVEFGRRTSPEPTPDLRTLLVRLGRRLSRRNAGLLITIDELQAAAPEEFRRFGSIIQHVTRRAGHPVAFVGAGIPLIEDRFLSGEEATFLQRCSRRDVGPLDDRAAAAAIAGPLHQRDAFIPPDALAAAVRAVSGYAFMTQLVGFHMWKAAAGPYRGITMEEATVGIAEAKRQMGRLVLAPIWKNLSQTDRRFLIAMSEDSEMSGLADVAARLKVTTGYAGVYRSRLIKAGMVTPVRKGWIRYTHHAARGWIRRQASDPGIG